MSKPLKSAALSPTPPRQTPDERRWELHYEILEQYIRRTQKLPSRGTLFEGIDIGTWFAYQMSRAELGLLTSAQQMKFDNLDAVLSEVTPSPLLPPILASAEHRRPTRPLGDYNIRATAPPPKPSALPKRVSPKPAPPKPSALPKRVSPKPAPPKVSEDAVPSVQPETIAPETTVHPVPAAPEAADARAASDAPIPEETVKPEEAAVTAAESTEEVTEPQEIADLRQLVTATTEFWDNHGRMPRKADRNIVVAGRKLPDWTWTLVPAINGGTLSDEHRAILETAPWWSLITERAVKQQRRAEIIASKKSDADGGTVKEDVSAPSAESVGDEEPADEAPADTPAPVPASTDEDKPSKPKRRKSGSSIPADKKVFKPYTKDRPHRTNPAARAASEAVADDALREEASPTVEKLPEVGLVGLTTFSTTGKHFRIRASRTVDTIGKATEAIAYLAENGVRARVSSAGFSRHTEGRYILCVVINVADVKVAVPRLVALGYAIYTVTSTAGFPTEG